MTSTENLMVGWLIYIFAGLCMMLAVWKISWILKFTGLRLWLTLTTAAFMFQPWFSPEPDNYVAPAIIVAVFAFLDGIGNGLSQALKGIFESLLPAIGFSLIVAIVCVTWGIVKIQKRNSSQESEQSS